MKKNCCPLCLAAGTHRVESIPTQDIADLYWRCLDIDTREDLARTTSLDYLHCPQCDLHFFSPMIVGSRPFYQALQAFDWYYLKEKYEFFFCSGFLPSGARVLDIGCGEGRFKNAMKDGSYVGLEPYGITTSKLVVPLDVDAFAATNPEPFDAVCAFQVLEHQPHPQAFLRSALSMLKQGGTLMLSTPSHDSFLRDVTNSPLAMPPHHVTHWPDTTFRYLEAFGLRLDRLHHEPLQDIHVPWFCEKLCQEQLKRNSNGTKVGGQLDLSQEFKEIEIRAAEMAKELLPVFSEKPWRPAGHTVIAIYTKTGDAEVNTCGS